MAQHPLQKMLLLFCLQYDLNPQRQLIAGASFVQNRSKFEHLVSPGCVHVLQVDELHCEPFGQVALSSTVPLQLLSLPSQISACG
jgi:hypothetical protein